jgi:hypothetical protein
VEQCVSVLRLTAHERLNADLRCMQHLYARLTQNMLKNTMTTTAPASTGESAQPWKKRGMRQPWGHGRAANPIIKVRQQHGSSRLAGVSKTQGG